MPLERELSACLLEQTLAEGLTLTGPLLNPELLWAGRSPPVAAADYARFLQAKQLDKGELSGLLEAGLVWTGLSVEPLVLRVPNPGRKGQPLRLSIQVATGSPGPGRSVALAPSLGMMAEGADSATAVAALRERAVFELGFREAAIDGAGLLGCTGPAALTLHTEPIGLTLYTGAERRARFGTQEPLAPRLLQSLHTGRPTAFLREPELLALAAALEGARPRPVLLVGPHGVGKSAILLERLRRDHGRVAGGPVWRCAAAVFLLRLMAEGSWQQALAALLLELKEAGASLWVANLAELFEVGRYEGNPTSIGEALRPAVQRGDLRIVSEATAEQVAELEARYPGVLDGWQRFVVAEPGTQLPALVAAWAEAERGPMGVNIDGDAIPELLRLQRRFTPYAGFPGRSLRFLAALAQQEGKERSSRSIGRLDVLRRFAHETGIPLSLIDPMAPLSRTEVESFFQERIYGQAGAVAALVDIVVGIKADVSRWGKPLSSLLLVGPTGVGKTETARALATFLFGSPERLLRFDMSEFSTPGAVLRLTGLGEQEGLLTGAVRREPFSLLLFDEVEKADPAFLDLLLQALGEGRLTDGRGRTADLCSTVVILTSNIGAAEVARGSVGFGGTPDATRVMASFQRAVTDWLRPELRGRLDLILPFAPLDRAAVERVLDRELQAFRRRPGLEGVELRLGPALRTFLIERGYHPAWGGRQMIRALQEELAAPLARALATSTLRGHRVASVDRCDGIVTVKLEAGPAVVIGTGDSTACRGPHGELLALLHGRAWALLDAALSRGRLRGRPADGSYRLPTPAELLAAEIAALEQRARALAMNASFAAITGAALSPFEATTRALDAELFRAERQLLHLTAGGDFAELGIYGRDETWVGRLVSIYQGVARVLDLEVALVHVWADSQKGTIETRTPEEKPPAEPWLFVGTELRLRGPCARLLVEEEPAHWEIGPPFVKTVLRLRSAVLGLDPKIKEKARPDELLRNPRPPGPDVTLRGNELRLHGSRRVLPLFSGASWEAVYADEVLKRFRAKITERVS